MRGTNHRAEPIPVRDIQVVVRGEMAEDVPDYARRKIALLAKYTGRPIHHARIGLIRHRNPAESRPISAQANLDVNGRVLRAQVRTVTAREAVDLLEQKLRRQLERMPTRGTQHVRRFVGRAAAGPGHVGGTGRVAARRRVLPG